MARAKKELPAEIDEVVQEEQPIEAEQPVNEAIPLEKIHELLFVEKGVLYRLDGIPGHARGDYRLVNA